MKPILLAATAVAALAVAVPAAATTIITLGQISRANTVTGIANVFGTHLSGNNIGVTITEIDSGAVTPPTPAFLDLSADSTSGATTPGNVTVVQHFGGTFSITSAPGDAGTNYLSGGFNDGIFGILGGTGLTLTADALFTSDVIGDLSAPRNLSFSFTNVTPKVSVSNTQSQNSVDCGPPFSTVGCNDTGETISSFGASLSGNASAAAPEPMSIALLGSGLLGLGATLGRRRKN
jgi:hypothetical protein